MITLYILYHHKSAKWEITHEGLVTTTIEKITSVGNWNTEGGCGSSYETRIKTGLKKVQMWWCMPVILALSRLRQEDHKVKTSPCYKRDPVSLEKKKKKKKES
jgi:hypothetical protein